MSALRKEELRIQAELEKARLDVDLINQEVEQNLKLHDQIVNNARSTEPEISVNHTDSMFTTDKNVS